MCFLVNKPWGGAISRWATSLIKTFTLSAHVASDGFVALAAVGGMAIEIQAMACTRLARTRARRQLVSPYDVVHARKCYKTSGAPSRRDTPTGRLAWLRPNALSTVRPVHQAAPGRAQPSCLQYTRLSAPRLRSVLVMGMPCPAHASTKSFACCKMMMPW